MSSDSVQVIAQHLPYLRRYARALTGDQGSGDQLVRASLERLLRNEQPLRDDSIKLSLYRALSLVWTEQALPAPAEGHVAIENSGIVAHGVARLGDVRRQILILSTLEGFAPTQVATIMALDEDEIRAELAAGKHELREQPPTRVLIIEDEPVIALDIEPHSGCCRPHGDRDRHDASRGGRSGASRSAWPGLGRYPPWRRQLGRRGRRGDIGALQRAGDLHHCISGPAVDR